LPRLDQERTAGGEHGDDEQGTERVVDHRAPPVGATFSGEYSPLA
jgi:hypothetical protein